MGEEEDLLAEERDLEVNYSGRFRGHRYKCFSMGGGETLGDARRVDRRESARDIWITKKRIWNLETFLRII